MSRKMKPSEFLEKHQWCRMEEALDKKGVPCDPTSRKAVKFCASGVIRKCKVPYQLENKLNEYLKNKGLNIDYIQFNDNYARRKRDVIRLFKKVGL